jgi:hypothetical protein
MGAREKKPRTRRLAKRTPRAQIAADAMVMSEEDAARKLGVSVRTLQRWRIEGKGPSFRKLGRLIGYTADDLGAFINSARRTSTSSAPLAAA